jgi:hypothetical protein
MNSLWGLSLKKDYEEWIKQFPVISIIQWRDDPLSTHYHFKRRKDMKMAMKGNANPWDTFSFAGKAWKGKVPDIEWAKRVLK